MKVGVESLLLGMDKGVWSSEVRFLSFKVKVLFYGSDFFINCRILLKIKV